MLRGRNFYLALVHYPVLNRNGETICSTVDSFDYFDAARLAQTYGIARLFVVNPEPAQKALVDRLIAHGRAEERAHVERGYFDRSEWVADVNAACARVQTLHGVAPRVVATTASAGPDATSISALRRRLEGDEPQLWLIGKAWGMAPALLQSADEIAKAIDAGTGYNHLSVRSALAIYIDRLLAPDDD